MLSPSTSHSLRSGVDYPTRLNESSWKPRTTRWGFQKSTHQDVNDWIRMATMEDANKRIRQLFDGTQKQCKFFQSKVCREFTPIGIQFYPRRDSAGAKIWNFCLYRPLARSFEDLQNAFSREYLSTLEQIVLLFLPDNHDHVCRQRISPCTNRKRWF